MIYTEVIGRLDNLVEAVYARYKDRFFQGEREGYFSSLKVSSDKYYVPGVIIDVQGDKYPAKVMKVYTPKVAFPTNFPPEDGDSSMESDEDTDDESKDAHLRWVVPESPHIVGGDMSITLQDSCYRDNPSQYVYTVQFVDDEGASDAQTQESNGVARTKWSGSLMEVQSDRISFVFHSAASILQ